MENPTSFYWSTENRSWPELPHICRWFVGWSYRRTFRPTLRVDVAVLPPNTCTVCWPVVVLPPGDCIWNTQISPNWFCHVVVVMMMIIYWRCLYVTESLRCLTVSRWTSTSGQSCSISLRILTQLKWRLTTQPAGGLLTPVSLCHSWPRSVCVTVWPHGQLVASWPRSVQQ